MDAIDEAWVRDNLVTYGHSFLATDDSYADLLAGLYEMTYPGSNLKRAVGGSLTEAAADVMLTSQPWIPDKRHGSNKVLLIQALINTARRHGVSAVTRQGAEHALRTMCALGSSLEVVPDNAPFFTYSGSWSNVAGSGYHSGECQVTTTPGDTVTFTVPADGCHFLTVGRNSDLSGAVIRFRRLDTNTIIQTWTNEDQSAQRDPRSYVAAAIPLRVPAGTKVRVELVSGANLLCDGLIVPADRPGPILLMKEPHLLDYSRSTAFPNGSDAALDYFNELLDVMAGEFPNVIVADPNTAGYWDKTAHILEDGVHPNELGHEALGDTMTDAIHTDLVRKSYEAGLYL